jgi:TctA family transporter
MHPLTVITGIVLGSCLSITLSLAAVLFIFLVLGDEYPRLRDEFDALINSLLIFIAMTAISSLSFYSILIRHQWRRGAQILMWLGVAATGSYYWP